MNVAASARARSHAGLQRRAVRRRQQKLHGVLREEFVCAFHFRDCSSAQLLFLLLLASSALHRRSSHASEQTGASKRENHSLTMGLVSFSKVILPALAGSCVVSYAFWDLARNRKIFGGTVPHTIQSSEWEKETNKKLDAWPREAAGPVVMNPISRQNYHKA